MMRLASAIASASTNLIKPGSIRVSLHKVVHDQTLPHLRALHSNRMLRAAKKGQGAYASIVELDMI
jgi:hypothetical protein